MVHVNLSTTMWYYQFNFAFFSKVILDTHDVDISWLDVDAEAHSTESFRAIYSGGRFQKFGKMMFKIDDSKLTVKKDYCPYYGDGCKCGNENLKNTICATDGAKCPREPKCSSKYENLLSNYTLHTSRMFLQIVYIFQ